MSLFAGQVGVSHLSQVQFLEVEPVLMKSAPRPALQTNRLALPVSIQEARKTAASIFLTRKTLEF